MVFFGLPRGQKVEYGGTGFLVVHKDGGYDFPYLVTARHVAKGLDGAVLRANTKDGGSGEMDIVVGRWYCHPDQSPNKFVDVALAEFALGEEFDCRYFPSDSLLSNEKRKNKNIGAGDLVQIVGLFRPLAGERENLVVVHSGSLALVPEEGETIPIEDAGVTKYVEGYLVEAQTLKGLSGSPVFVRRTVSAKPMKPEESPISPKAHGAVWLLGLYQGAWPGKPDKVLAEDRDFNGTVRVPVGMGIVCPASKIWDILEMDELKEVRRKKIE